MAIIWRNSEFSAFYSIDYEWENDYNIDNVPQEAAWYPGVLINFSDPEEWQVTAAVDLDSEKVVYVIQNPYRTGPKQEIEIESAPIHEVKVNIAESFPPQVILYIQGGLRDGCTTFHELTTERSGNHISVWVTTEHPKEVSCPAIYVYFDKNVNLGSDFIFGETYEVNVNDYSTSFKMQ
jgi:inhibitor of cysteine peptidase